MKVFKIEREDQYEFLTDLIDAIGLDKFDLKKEYIPKYNDKCFSFRLKGRQTWFRYRWKFADKIFKRKHHME